MFSDYQALFDTMEIKSSAYEDAKRIVLYRYTGYGNIPPYFLAALHLREGDLDFTTWLHNGDSLQHRTVNVPVGRIPNALPPFTWEQGVQDTITLNHWNEIQTWDIVTMLREAEMFNGLYYARHNLNSPYLWANTNHYQSGKFDRDGHYNPELVDKQKGVAAIIRLLSDKTLGIVQ